MGNDIHRPLGQNRAPGKGQRARTKASWIPAAMAVVIIAAIAGGAGWVALSGARIDQSPSVSATLEPETASTVPSVEDGAALANPDAETSVQGPDPVTSGGLLSQHGESGAIITATPDGEGGEINKITPITRPDNRPVLLTPPGRVGQDPRLAHLPDPAVVETTDAGRLPVRGVNGERAFDIYARPWSGTRGARVTIIVGGLGLSQTGTQRAIAILPEEITLAFAANGNSLQRWMQEARRQGHEILLQVPFEPFDYPANDPGPGTLTIAAGTEANLQTLHTAMARITNYTGITNFMGGRFLSDPTALEPVMRDLAGRGLMFVDDGTSARSLTDRFAKTLAIPFAASDMVLDATQERGYILSKLDDLERTARRNGAAVGVASAFDVSVDAIATWAEEAKARGIEIVSASAVAEDPER